jgi:hypothetical protein
MAWVRWAATALALVGCGQSFVVADDGGGDRSAATTSSASQGGGASGGGGAGTGASAGSTASAGGSSSGGGGAGGHGVCATCLEAMSSDGVVELGDVCDGINRQSYLELDECVCALNEYPATCSTACAAHCESNAAPGPCIVCLQQNDESTCESKRIACAEAE